MKVLDIINEGEVVAFPKKHKGDVSDMHSCPKCGGDVHGGKYMGHQVKVCMPCKQVYLPPNSGIDKRGNKIDNEDIERQHGDLKPWAYWNSPERVAQKLYKIHGGAPIGKDEVKHLWKVDGPDRMTKFMLKPDMSAILSNYEAMSDQGPLFKEGGEERKQNALWAQITDYEKRAKATSNDIKKQHYLKMASELRGKLKTHDDVEEAGYGRNRGYHHGFADPNAPTLGRHHRDMDDESNLLYIYRDGRVKQRMISNRDERSARAEGYRDSPEQALRIHNIIRSKFDPNKWVQKVGDKWVQVHPFGSPEDVAERAVSKAQQKFMGMVHAAQKGEKPASKEIAKVAKSMPKKAATDYASTKHKGLPAKKTTESATSGATSAANIGTVDAPHISPGKARGKKSYIGNPWGGQSGTKAPPQPKIVQPKNKDGTAKNGLDSSNLLGGGAIKR